jgi:murein DD-endopeptidase MepM/ murein hydrolase activator NlpD
MTRATLEEQWAALSGRAGEFWRKFRASRLYWQVLASLALVAVTGCLAVLPGTPALQARTQLQRVVRQDYDFAGQWRRTDRWAKAQGGWQRAAGGLWATGTAKVKGYVARLPGMPKPDPDSTPSPTPTPVAQTAADTPTPATPETIMPVTGKLLYGFGWLPKGKRPHEGLDLAAAVGTPVYAVSDGTVLRFGTDPYAGGTVEVDHGFGVALYGQVTAIRVKPGDKVKKGDILATVAKPTGKEGDTAPHLHFELRPAGGGNAIDPAPYLPAAAGGQGGSGT